MYLGVGQEQSERLVAHACTEELLDAIDLLKVDGHRKDEDATRMVDLVCARARRQVLHVEEHSQARADLTAALLDELAHVLAERPRICFENMEGRQCISQGKDKDKGKEGMDGSFQGHYVRQGSVGMMALAYVRGKYGSTATA
eukprot:6438472-Prymnesium_polylepis.2